MREPLRDRRFDSRDPLRERLREPLRERLSDFREPDRDREPLCLEPLCDRLDACDSFEPLRERFESAFDAFDRLLEWREPAFDTLERDRERLDPLEPFGEVTGAGD